MKVTIKKASAGFDSQLLKAENIEAFSPEPIQPARTCWMRQVA